MIGHGPVRDVYVVKYGMIKITESVYITKL